METNSRPFDYTENVCWQYDIRQKNYEKDLKDSGLTEEQVSNLTVNDFEFFAFTKDHECYPMQFRKVKKFIERHEWLGSMSLYPTHFFTATHKDTGILTGVVVMDLPASFSKLLGENTRSIERLISRGACISWSPKNLASALITWSMKWTVDHSRFRIFTAYSDPEARELGTIYQACNFYYLGQGHGTVKKYRYPDTDKWISDRSFRTRSAYKRYAKDLNIEWGQEWNKGSKMLWENIPDDVEERLREESRRQYKICECRTVPRKHKYCYVLGTDKKETRELRKRFEELNPNRPEYPKER